MTLEQAVSRLPEQQLENLVGAYERYVRQIARRRLNSAIFDPSSYICPMGA